MNHWIHTQLRIIRAGAQNFVRNATLAVAAMAVMVITLGILLFSIIANATFSYTVQQFTGKIDVSVYLKDEITETQRAKLVTDIKNISNVRGVDYISKDQALEDYKESNKDNLSLLLAISQTDNPLPASLRVKLKDPDTVKVQPLIDF